MNRAARFRFYGSLNDFLPPDRRQRTVRYDFAGRPAVKDSMEALGVPHPEVALIAVGKNPVGFDHRISPGERIAVYPSFRGLKVGPEILLQPPPLIEPAFILDVHLGKLARRLRMLGFDCLYRNDYDDREIIRIARREDRTILTRDRGLLKNSAVRRGYWLRAQTPAVQLREVVERFNLKGRFRPFRRCMVCNGLLEEVSRQEVLDRLPPRTRKEHNQFKRCTGCGKIYWPGSHHRAMQERIARLLN
ncbi:MAG: Mut7-C RNAse domain-containing protein [Candidatus Erginobacter occultus]|nr:Mut7-C RNAse domain-containing protein [Candidatus Erginobacter occultus]